MYSRFAKALSTSSVAVSQVFRGPRELSLEQGVRLAEFLGLNTLETDYFLLLLHKARAGSHALGKILSRQIAELRARGQEVATRIVHEQLSDEDKAVFYSNWLYLAVWLGAS